MVRRTNIDFSKHEIKETKFDGVLIHEFKKPNRNIYGLTFINTRGIMTVTGDFGNWVFCREFHPSASNEHGVSGSYWDEKLQMTSVQKSDKYDSEETLKTINEFKETFEDSYGEEMDEEVIDWIERLENNVDNELDYTYIAYQEKPNTIEYEDVPFGEKRHPWLDAVYDGFDAICQKLYNENLVKEKK